MKMYVNEVVVHPFDTNIMDLGGNITYIYSRDALHA